MQKEKTAIDRRKLLGATMLAGAAAATGEELFAAGEGGPKGGQSIMRLGDVITPPDKEGHEKHVPVIDAPASVAAGARFPVTVTVGKQVHHPNTVQHHIKWVQVFAKQEGSRPPVHLGTFDLGPAFAEPKITFTAMVGKTSEIIALSYCNIHGLWDNSVTVKVT